eukprot:SAG31_NODE_115_length_24128_cov_47.693912_3_plen_118_part_00
MAEDTGANRGAPHKTVIARGDGVTGCRTVAQTDKDEIMTALDAATSLMLEHVVQSAGQPTSYVVNPDSKLAGFAEHAVLAAIEMAQSAAKTYALPVEAVLECGLPKTVRLFLSLFVS